MKVSNITTWTRDSVTIRVGESIDFKSATEEKTSVGRIEEFKNVDEDSMWMRVTDLGEADKSEWISCNNWFNRFGAAKIGNTINAQNDDTSNAIAAVGDLPF